MTVAEADMPRLRAGAHVTLNDRPAVIFAEPTSSASTFVIVRFTDRRGGLRIAAGHELTRRDA